MGLCTAGKYNQSIASVEGTAPVQLYSPWPVPVNVLTHNPVRNGPSFQAYTHYCNIISFHNNTHEASSKPCMKHGNLFSSSSTISFHKPKCTWQERTDIAARMLQFLRDIEGECHAGRGDFRNEIVNRAITNSLPKHKILTQLPPAEFSRICTEEEAL